MKASDNKHSMLGYYRFKLAFFSVSTSNKVFKFKDFKGRDVYFTRAIDKMGGEAYWLPADRHNVTPGVVVPIPWVKYILVSSRYYV